MEPSPPTTDNHSLPLIPYVGETNADQYANKWGKILNDAGWSVLEKRLVVRDVASNKDKYTPYQNALFRATDTGAWYTGDGSNWTLADSSVSSLTASTASLGNTTLTGSVTSSNGVTVWDASNQYIPHSQLESNTITVSGNTITLGGSIQLDHNDLTGVAESSHHEWPVSNSNLSHNSITISGTSVALGESMQLDHSDLSTTSISASDHHEWPISNDNLASSNVTVAGNTVSLGGSTTISHADLTSTSSSDHHSYPVPNSGLVNNSVTVAGNTVGLGGTTAISHSDLSSTSSSDHHAYPVPNSGLSNDTITLSGNSVSLGGSTSIAHGDLSGVSANDHHTAHEHPGDQPATGTINANSNSITGVTDLTGQYATHSFTGSTYNIDLRDSSVDARFRTTAGNTIVWFRESGNVDVPNGQLSEQSNRVATRTWVDGEISAGASSLSGLDSAVSALQSNKLDSSAYTPESDTHAKTTSASALSDVSADSVSNAHHTRYTDSEAVSAVNNAADHGSTASHNYFSGSHSDLSNVASSDHHSRYTDTEAVNAVEAHIDTAASSISGLDDQVSTNNTKVTSNTTAINSLQNNKLDISNYAPVSDINAENSLNVDIGGNADSVDGYDIVVNGEDAAGVINFKTE